MNLVIEIICFLASITLFFQASIPQYMKTFPFFMLITLIVEITGWLFMEYKIDKSYITLLYNVFTAFEFEYYLLIIRFTVFNKKAKRIVSWLVAVYPFLVLIDMLFVQPDAFHTITYSLG